MAGGAAQAQVNTDVLERDPALDGVRGFALSMVLIGHGFGVAPGGFVTNFLHTVADSMQVSLDLFFVLSGFLISSILIRTRHDHGYFRNFYARRVLRIFPAYYAVLAGVYLVRPLLFGDPSWQGRMEQAAPYYLLYIQNMVMAWTGEGLGWVGLFHTFSLAIEEQFYLFWPLVIWFTPKQRLLRVCLMLCAGSLAIKFMMYGTGQSWWAVYMSTFPRLHALAAGGALAAWLGIHQQRRVPPWLRTVGLVAGVCLIIEVVARALKLISWEFQGLLLNITAMPFFSWALLETILADKRALVRRVLEWRPLTWLGSYSYGLYLIHAVVLWEIRTRYLRGLADVMPLNLALPLTGFVGISVSLVLAVAMFHLLEQPVLRLKRYFAPARPGRTGVAAV